MTATTNNKTTKKNTNHKGEYNYEDYSKTEAFKNIQVLEVIDVKKFKWEWTTPTPNQKGIYHYSKRLINKYKLHEFSKK